MDGFKNSLPLRSVTILKYKGKKMKYLCNVCTNGAELVADENVSCLPSIFDEIRRSRYLAKTAVEKLQNSLEDVRRDISRHSELRASIGR